MLPNGNSPVVQGLSKSLFWCQPSISWSTRNEGEIWQVALYSSETSWLTKNLNPRTPVAQKITDHWVLDAFQLIIFAGKAQICYKNQGFLWFRN